MIPEKTSIASCGWYMERLKRFSALSLLPMGGLSASLTSARIAPVPGSHVCVVYERCAPHEGDSCHSGHVSACGGIEPRGATRQRHAAANAGAAARGRGFAAGRQVFGAPDMARQDFLAPCMVIASVRHDTGVRRTRCRTTGTEGKRACVGQERQGDGESPGEVAVPVREPRLSRCESLADARDLPLATVCSLRGT